MRNPNRKSMSRDIHTRLNQIVKELEGVEIVASTKLSEAERNKLERQSGQQIGVNDTTWKIGYDTETASDSRQQIGVDDATWRIGYDTKTTSDNSGQQIIGVEIHRRLDEISRQLEHLASANTVSNISRSGRQSATRISTDDAASRDINAGINQIIRGLDGLKRR